MKKQNEAWVNIFFSYDRTNILTGNNENIAARNSLCMPSNTKILLGYKNGLKGI